MCVLCWRWCGNRLRGLGRLGLIAGIIFISLYLIAGSFSITNSQDVLSVQGEYKEEIDVDQDDLPHPQYGRFYDPDEYNINDSSFEHHEEVELHEQDMDNIRVGLHDPANNEMANPNDPVGVIHPVPDPKPVHGDDSNYNVLLDTFKKRMINKMKGKKEDVGGERLSWLNKDVQNLPTDNIDEPKYIGQNPRDDQDNQSLPLNKLDTIMVKPTDVQGQLGKIIKDNGEDPARPPENKTRTTETVKNNIPDNINITHPKVDNREITRPKVDNRNINHPKVDNRNINITRPKVDNRNINITRPKVDNRNINITQPKVDNRNITHPKMNNRDINITKPKYNRNPNRNHDKNENHTNQVTEKPDGQGNRGNRGNNPQFKYPPDRNKDTLYKLLDPKKSVRFPPMPIIPNIPSEPKWLFRPPKRRIRPHNIYSHKSVTKPEPIPLYDLWKSYTFNACENTFIGYNYQFAQLRNVLVTKSLAAGEEGGKDMAKVMGQNEEKEFYNAQLGFFTMQCHSNVKYFFDGRVNYLNEWIKVLYTQNRNISAADVVVNERFTIAIVRYEYVNMYHTMTDWYNAFLVMNFLNSTASDTDILFIDAHPKGSLDPVWGDLFNSYKFLSQISERTLFTNFVWGMQGYNSPLSQFEATSLPYVEQFREFFLNRYNIQMDYSLNCQQLNILFIWRRDYVAHPRNAGGLISRKIKNEDKLIKALQQAYPQHNVQGRQLDLLPMRDQLHYISQTDILIGMHGAGLTLALFLPKHSGVIEFFPNYWPESNEHFKLISSWRGLHHVSWSNFDEDNEFEDNYTRIPPGNATELVGQIIGKMCQNPYSNPAIIKATNVTSTMSNRLQKVAPSTGPKHVPKVAPSVAPSTVFKHVQKVVPSMVSKRIQKGSSS